MNSKASATENTGRSAAPVELDRHVVGAQPVNGCLDDLRIQQLDFDRNSLQMCTIINGLSPGKSPRREVQCTVGDRGHYTCGRFRSERINLKRLNADPDCALEPNVHVHSELR